MGCPYSWVSGWKGCTEDKKCVECLAMKKILAAGKCVECKKPTSKEVLRENGGTCESCTAKEMEESDFNEEGVDEEEDCCGADNCDDCSSCDS